MKPAGEIHATRGRGRSPALWRQGQDHGELRRPHTVPNVPGSVGAAENSIAASEQGAGGDVSRRSTLSADAKEFFPKGYQSGQFEGQFVEGPLEGGDCPLMVPHFNSMSSSIPEQLTLNHLVDVIQQLTLNPGKFNALVEPFVETFGQYLNDSATVKAVVSAIVEQSIVQPNFRYSGARLCNYLRNASSGSTQNSFRACVLKRCQEENERVPLMMGTNPQRVHGYALFLAELFMQLDMSKGSSDRITILGQSVSQILNTLLSRPMHIPDVKCVCQVLKLAGLQLDKLDCQLLNEVFERLLMVLSFCSEPSVVLMIRNIIQLRHCAWGNTTSAPLLNSSQQLQTSKNEPVFYGPDGKILTAEESRFLQDSVGSGHEGEEYDEYGEDGEVWMQDDEMDDEFEAAYEEFLQMTENQSKNT